MSLSIEEKRTKLAQLQNELAKSEGARESNLVSLKNNFDLATIEEAEKLLKKIEAQVAELDEDIPDIAAKLEKSIDWESL